MLALTQSVAASISEKYAKAEVLAGAVAGFAGIGQLSEASGLASQIDPASSTAKAWIAAARGAASGGLQADALNFLVLADESAMSEPDVYFRARALLELALALGEVRPSEQVVRVLRLAETVAEQVGPSWRAEMLTEIGAALGLMGSPRAGER